VAEELEAAEKLFEEGKPTDAASKAYMAKSQLSYATSSRPQGIDALKNGGDKTVDEFMRQLAAHEAFTGPGGEEQLKKIDGVAKAVSEKASAMVKKNRAELKRPHG
jgi:hypothetical protein